MTNVLALAFPFAQGSSMNSVALLLFTLYLAAMVGIGLWASRRTGDTEEGYFLGGRSLSPFVVALSAVSSGRSAWLVIGASALAWKMGLSALWLFPGYIVAEYVLLFTLGRRLRERSAQYGAITIPEVLAARDTKRPVAALWLRRIAGLVVVIFLTAYVSAQLVAGGKALESIFAIDGKTWGLTITAFIVLAYTLLGGYQAVALTDVLQGIFMLFGLVLLPLLGLHSLGGFGPLFEALRAIDPALVDWRGGWLAGLSGVAIGLGSFGNPPILVRAMSIENPQKLRSAARIGLMWNVVMAAGTLLIGLVGRALYPTTDAFQNADPDFLYPTIGALLSAKYLFAGFVGVLLAALFAAVMSTCDSQLLVVASSFVRDFRSGERERESVLASRLMVLIALVAAVALSFGDDRYVGPFVLYSWGALGAAFGPALVFALYARRATAPGLLTGVVVGALTAVVWNAVPELKSTTRDLIPACVLSSVAIWTISRRARR